MAEKSLCSIPGCSKPALARGWCDMHYRRWRRHGDPKGGGTSYGEPLKFLLGALHYDGDQCLFWPFSTSSGYGQIWIDGEKHYTHRYVCIKAHGEPPTPEHETAHNCGMGHLGCIAPNHLRWATHAENLDDMVMHGTRPIGEKNGASILTEDDVKKIWNLRGVHSQYRIAELFGVSRGAISDIFLGRNWIWVTNSLRKAQ